MIQGIWKEVPNPLAGLQRKSIRMQRKLFLYWLSMLLVIFSIFLVVLHIAGVFSALDKEMNQLLLARQKNVMTDLSYQLGKMTAQGIAVSEQTSATLSNVLFTDPVAALNDQPEQIGELEALLYGHLTAALRATPCSGAYLVLDATTNTKAPGAQSSRAGLYLRLANLSSKSAANQDIVFYRGIADVAREHQLELHNRWKLEFDISNLPGYDAMLDLPPERLAESAVWTQRICLPGTDGTVMGVCGLELSELYFMLSYPSEQSNLGSMVTLLAPINGDSLPLSQAMTGRLGDTYLDTEDTLQIKEGKYFNQYIGDSQTFLGVHTPVDLPMADGSRMYAVTLLPQHPYLRTRALGQIFWVLGTCLVVAILLLLSVYLSSSFVQPISRSLALLQNGDPLHSECSGVSEIDELFEFIQTKIQTAGGSQLPSNIEDLFASFARRAATLTPTEHNILKYYADGKGVSEVAEQACISINTVRRHNANIYQKLGVNSREELLLYIELFRRCDRLEELM